MKVFISYRRSDSRHIAGRISDRLNDSPGIGKVFIDIEGIDPGVNFNTKLDEALSESDVCLVVMGDDWIGVSENGNPVRILDDNDFVRYETAAALGSRAKVIPVLVDGAAMPKATDLPPDVRSIVTIDAVFIRHASFNQDMSLVEDAVFSRQARTPITRFFRRRPFLTLLLIAVIGMLVAGLSLIGLGVIHSLVTDGRALDETLGSQGMVWLVIIGSIVLGAAVPVWIWRRR